VSPVSLLAGLGGLRPSSGVRSLSVVSGFVEGSVLLYQFELLPAGRADLATVVSDSCNPEELHELQTTFFRGLGHSSLIPSLA
jgi:hypothetical protein